MATGRLIDSQRQELVRRFRDGESTQALADLFGCSPTTITRMVRAEMGPDAYALLREQRQKKPGRNRQISLAIDNPPDAGPAEPDDLATAPASEADGDDVAPDGGGAIPLVSSEDQHREQGARGDDEGDRIPGVPCASRGQSQPGQESPIGSEDEASLEDPNGGGAVLAIDDADDFGDDEGEDDLLSMEEESEEAAMGDFHPVAVLPIAVDDQQETLPAPWSLEGLPSCAYLLVDKTVELQAKPLGDIPELGRLPSEELQRQALVLFTNPRQAKRHCGRTQRVIKLPDLALLGRTAPYLLAQGISRVVIEGALYALPEEQ
ncbi:MAG: helix-turn-helix domain-containing protein [Cyanobacteriota bacterium]|nr:helix-turn-helix domain-containing protein [Cyanobacteriota bacterium]